MSPRAARRARPLDVRTDDLGPPALVRRRRPRGPTRGDAREDSGDPARRVLSHDRYRVRAHHGPRPEALDPRARRRRRRTTTSSDEQRRILSALSEAEVFEKFLHTRYVGQKRFGLEGAESTIVALQTVLDEAADRGRQRSGYRHGAPRTAQRAREHRRQVLQRHLLRVRGQPRPRERPGQRRRQVPQGRARRLQEPARRHHRRLDGVEPVAPRSGQPRRRRNRARQAGPRDPSERRHRAGSRPSSSTPTSRFSSTATRPSRARVSSPRRSTSLSSRGTASAARSTS